MEQGDIGRRNKVKEVEGRKREIKGRKGGRKESLLERRKEGRRQVDLGRRRD